VGRIGKREKTRIMSMVADNIYTSSQHLIPTLHLLRPIYSRILRRNAQVQRFHASVPRFDCRYDVKTQARAARAFFAAAASRAFSSVSKHDNTVKSLTALTISNSLL